MNYVERKRFLSYTVNVKERAVTALTVSEYEKISAPIRKKGSLIKALIIINTVLTDIVYVAYPALLVFIFFADRQKLVRTVLVPAVMFIAVSAARKIINRPRPYEKLEIIPLIKKDKKGESMPSRHIFSVFIIAMAFYYVNALCSIPFFIIGVLLSAVRIIGGVHYPSDIIVGAAIGIVAGIVGFFII